LRCMCSTAAVYVALAAETAAQEAQASA